jgi:hypothetical protein
MFSTSRVPEVAAAAGAMLIGRRTYEAGNRMQARQAQVLLETIQVVLPAARS